VGETRGWQATGGKTEERSGAMKNTEQIAKHLIDVHFGANWTGANLKAKLADVTWRQATARVGSFHSIATLVFHMNYYVAATIQVLRGGTLDAKDELSFDSPPVESARDWENLKDKTWSEAEELASLVERMPDDQLSEFFVEEKYGTYFRCLQGPVEHCHYHLGQIAMVKTLLERDGDASSGAS